ncbi:AEC family transporter [Hominifimenecus microfluidus]|uniref:AEC family transporter n=1 Tax=Hominifimenecus microfluidus TaxID=2885348 RepID=A0AAE3JGF2_9FIRM|nr:AEC family transporter [Hominifimenecus microfluidus]MCC2232508.1 AEC family transporter [Hominifimenecus microfluidus]
MEYHIIVINIFLIFALILVGFVAGKAHLVSEQASKDLSAILVEITLPASIFSSMLRELETDLLINAALLFFIGFACLALEYGAGRLLVKFFRIRKENQGLFLYNSMFTNASFMGFPVANAIFGSVGVFLASIVNLSLTITTFSFGIGLVRGDQESKEKFSLRKNVFTNINIAIILGMICFLTGFRFPEPAENFIAYFANVTTPMSMLVVGLNMSKGRARDLMTDRDAHLLTITRLIVMPLLLFGILKLLPLGAYPLVAQMILVVFAMPVPALCLILSEKYGGNTQFAVTTIFQTTLFSIVTIPLLLLLIV